MKISSINTANLFSNIYLIALIIFFICGSYRSVAENNQEEALFIKSDEKAGIHSLGYLGHNATWVDFNSDGCLDLFASNTYIRPPNLFIFQNNCDGTFELLNNNTGIYKDKYLIISSSAGDVDNDGLVDIVLGTNSFYGLPILYRNIGEFNFIKSNEYSNLNIQSLAKSIIFADYNLDGYLDIFQSTFKRVFLYKNDNRGFFEELSEKSGLPVNVKSLNSGHWFDYNNDKYPDLFLNFDGFNMLYENNHDGTFRDVSHQSGLMGSNKWDSVAACSGDIDNDGDMDLFVVNISSKRNALYINNGNGTFTDVTEESGISGVGDGRTCSIVDYNSDGLNDIFTTNHIRPSRLYKNLGNNRFRDVAYQTGIHEPVDAFSATWGDYNGDAVMDVFLNGHMGIALYEGFNLNNSVVIELVGDGINTNTSAIGSRVELITKNLRQIRDVSGGKGCCENDMLPLHFGLGKESAFEMTVKWTSGKTCTYKNLNAEDKRIYKVWEKGCEVFSY